MTDLRDSALRGSAFAAALACAVPAQADTLKVFAAASLSDALDEALEVCRVETGTNSIGVYAGSGTAARQVAQGAPASIYISANPQWMDWLEQRELIATDTRIDLLGNRLVMLLAKHADVALLDYHLPGNKWIEYAAELRIAIGDPETVPAGIYARQALQEDGLWDNPVFQSGIVQSSNVREVLTWVFRGEVGVGIVYQTDALKVPQLSKLTINAEDHDPIRYPAAVVADYDTPKARDLLTCLKGEKASDVFKQFGFGLLE